MRIRRSNSASGKIDMQMTPMIDIVFQLQIFFLFSFKIVLPEGDFNIRMPSAAAARTMEISESIPTPLVMKADADGRLADMRLGGRSFGNGPDAFLKLHSQIRGMVDDAGGPGTADDLEVELDCDYNLNYEHVMRAITAITGYIENGQPHKVIERVNFTPPKNG